MSKTIVVGQPATSFSSNGQTASAKKATWEGRAPVDGANVESAGTSGASTRRSGIDLSTITYNVNSISSGGYPGNCLTASTCYDALGATQKTLQALDSSNNQVSVSGIEVSVDFTGDGTTNPIGCVQYNTNTSLWESASANSTYVCLATYAPVTMALYKQSNTTFTYSSSAVQYSSSVTYSSSATTNSTATTNTTTNSSTNTTDTASSSSSISVPTPTPTTTDVTMTQAIIFSGLPTNWNASANETTSYNLGYRNTICPSVCSGSASCGCSSTFTVGSRRSATLTFTSLVAAALASSATTAADALQTDATALANAITAAANTLGVTLSYYPNASQMAASASSNNAPTPTPTPTPSTTTSDDDDNTTLIIALSAGIGGGVLLIILIVVIICCCSNREAETFHVEPSKADEENAQPVVSRVYLEPEPPKIRHQEPVSSVEMEDRRPSREVETADTSASRDCLMVKAGESLGRSCC